VTKDLTKRKGWACIKTSKLRAERERSRQLDMGADAFRGTGLALSTQGGFWKGQNSRVVRRAEKDRQKSADEQEKSGSLKRTTAPEGAFRGDDLQG